MAEPRIVFFDLETLADLRAVMTHLPSLSDYPGKTLKASINSVICFGYKVLGSRVECLNAWDYRGWRNNVNDDRELVSAAADILRTADCVVTFNGKRFDWKFLQTRLTHHGIRPLPKIPHVDMCAVVKSNLYLINNRMNTVAKHLKTIEKVDNGGWELWERVQRREPKAMRLMTKYCKGDVETLEQIFKTLRPLITGIPNYNVFTNAGSKNVCPNCASTRLICEGIRATQARTYRRYCCKDCGTWSRTDVNDKHPRTL